MLLQQPIEVGCRIAASILCLHAPHSSSNTSTLTLSSTRKARSAHLLNPEADVQRFVLAPASYVGSSGNILTKEA
ncbi:hypothetical protein C0Q70_17018 [Pomacea canaliculata]|uniref:Uncharacterized protein n=1 Tax=Pomacea canaliculata TaxID=400727 RepID=A0A2T7NRD6_POMCA|nr:hypothetical protein C0Q70_17018 [Pomacea canaliculata]